MRKSGRGQLTIVNHPSASVFLTRARDESTDTETFADMLRRIGYVLAARVIESCAHTKAHPVTTPLNAVANGHVFSGRVALAPVMRAGNILQEGFRTFLVRPLIWHITLSRNEETLGTNVIGVKVPPSPPKDIDTVIVLEVMLATGGSAITAIEILKERGNKNIVFVCVVAAPEGIAAVHARHPDVPIFTVAVDDGLTKDHPAFLDGYIYPGLGDAGDRSYPLT